MKNAASELEWSQLGFQYLPTEGFVQIDYADGHWSEPEINTHPYLSMHVAANCLHYGQACFEGLKAFTTRDGSVGLFRPEQNARRMQLSADRLVMQCPPEDLFIDACLQVVRHNRAFVPPYGSGASLYVRPLLVGTEPMVGIRPSSTFTFLVLVTPVGPYYKDGFFPVEAVVIDDFDRAAPHGLGRAKAAGNYAASLQPNEVAHAQGYPLVLFTDPREHKYVDEFGTSNFIGITPSGEYKTPNSSSILASITNDSLRVLAQEMGLTIEQAPIALTDLDQFSEVGACGTAAVITPVSAIHCHERVYTYGSPRQAGAMLTKLYQELQGIQYGDIPDRHHWLTVVR